MKKIEMQVVKVHDDNYRVIMEPNFSDEAEIIQIDQEQIDDEYFIQSDNLLHYSAKMVEEPIKRINYE